MAIIRPFRALHYNNSISADISDLTAPPYDVITPEAQEAYYRLHENNIIRLILNKSLMSDSESENAYTRAAETLHRWREEKTLVRDNALSFYLYEQSFKYKGKPHTVRGIVGRVKLEDLDSGSILAHEKTLQKPKDDRLELLTACRANLSQIYGLYSDPKKILNKIFTKTLKKEPLLRAKSEDDVLHQVFQIDDKADIEIITQVLADKDIFIADGHHRYETALAFRDREAQTRKVSSKDAVNFVMMMLVNMESEELTILPTHRLLRGLTTANPRLFKKRVEPYFDVISIDNPEGCHKEMMRRLQAQHKTSFGLYFGQNRCFLLKLLDYAKIEHMIDPTYSEAWKHLDVTILHEAIIENLLGFSQVELEPKNLIKFVKEEELAFKYVDEHEYQLAFLLNATKIEELKSVALCRERMPQKSTHFYPKLQSGLLLNPLE